MASWEDGAEYAPIERPDGFAAPSTAPLDHVVLVDSSTPGAIAPPDAYIAADASVPLDRLVPASGPLRDPRQAFDVAGALLTAEATVRAPEFDPLQPVASPPLMPTTVFPPPFAEPVIPVGQSFPPPHSAPVAPPGQWSPQQPSQPPPQPRAAPIAIAQLLWVATGMLVLGFLLQAAAVILGYAATALVIRALPTKTKLGIAIVLSFTAALFISWTTDDPAASYLIARFTSLIWAFVIGSFALSATAARYR